MSEQDWKRAAIQAKNDLRAIERQFAEGYTPIGPGQVFAQWTSPANTMRWIEDMERDEEFALMEEIERAWMERGDGTVVDRLAAEHPALAEKLRSFFEIMRDSTVQALASARSNAPSLTGAAVASGALPVRRATQTNEQP